MAQVVGKEYSFSVSQVYQNGYKIFPFMGKRSKMRKMMYAILAVPIIAALIAGVAFFPNLFGMTAIAAPQQTPQTNSQAIEEEDDDIGEQEDGDDEAEDEVDESVDPSLANQAKITATEAGAIAANHLSVQSSAVKAIELEQEDGQLRYSVELTKDNHTFDVEVDAMTGDVGTVEQDD